MNDIKYFKTKLAIFGVLIIFIMFALIKTDPNITGYASVTSSVNHTDNLRLIINESINYTWTLLNSGDLQYVKITGSVSINGSAKVYIENKGNLYLIADTNDLLYSGLGKITGLSVSEINLGDQLNNSISNNSSAVDLDADLLTGDIQTILEYKKGSDYDIDNNGIAQIDDIIDYSVADTDISFLPNKNNICTKWQINSVDTNDLSQVCFGSFKCCDFINLNSIRDYWNDSFYLYYGQYGTTLNNTVSSQVIYVDYNLSVQNPYSNIFYGNTKQLQAIFYKMSTPVMEFGKVCKDTCILSGFNKSSYNLVFLLDNDSTLIIDSLDYSIDENLKLSKGKIKNQKGKYKFLTANSIQSISLDSAKLISNDNETLIIKNSSIYSTQDYSMNIFMFRAKADRVLMDFTSWQLGGFASSDIPLYLSSDTRAAFYVDLGVMKAYVRDNSGIKWCNPINYDWDRYHNFSVELGADTNFYIDGNLECTIDKQIDNLPIIISEKNKFGNLNILVNYVKVS